MTNCQRNTLLGVSLLIVFVFLCWFFAVLIGASSGEAAVALGGVIGGADDGEAAQADALPPPPLDEDFPGRRPQIAGSDLRNQASRSRP